MSTVTTTSWHSYPKVYNLGHAAIVDLFKDQVTVEEKIDGSQFSFGVIDGKLRTRSHGQEFPVEAPPGMFEAAVAAALELAPKLTPDWTYRGEYLRKPKHNTLAYDRTPNKHIIIFDINTGDEAYMRWQAKEAETHRIGLECVPCILEGPVHGVDVIATLMDRVSILGGSKIEGLVFKNYLRFGADGKALFGKHVSEAFKEIHHGDWRKDNPTGGDIVDQLCAAYRTPARWQKAVQHLREAGTLQNGPQDIGPLMRAVNNDIEAECATEIKERLYSWARKKILHSACAGLPEWYKGELAAAQFAGYK